MKKTFLFLSLSLIMTPVFGGSTSLGDTSWRGMADFKKNVQTQTPTNQSELDEMNELSNGNLTGKKNLTQQQQQTQSDTLEGAKTQANDIGNASRTTSLKVDSNGNMKPIQHNGLDVYEFEMLPVNKGRTAVSMITLTSPLLDANKQPIQIYVYNNGGYTLRNKPNPVGQIMYDPITKKPIMTEKLVPMYDKENAGMNASVKNNKDNSNSAQGQYAGEHKLEATDKVSYSDKGSGGAKLKSTKALKGLTIQADYTSNVYSGFKWTELGFSFLIDKAQMASLAKVSGTNKVQTLETKVCIKGLQGGMCECDPTADYAKKDPSFCSAFNQDMSLGKVWKNLTLQNTGAVVSLSFDTGDIDFSLSCADSTTNKNTCTINAKITSDMRILDSENTTSPYSFGGDNTYTSLTNAQQSNDMTDGIKGSSSTLKDCMNGVSNAVDNPDPATGNVGSFNTCGKEPEFQKTINSPKGTEAEPNGKNCTMQPKGTTTKSSSVEKSCTREWDAVYYTCDNATQNTVCNVSRTVSPNQYTCVYEEINTTTNTYIVTMIPKVDPTTKAIIYDAVTGKPIMVPDVTTTTSSNTTNSGCEAYRDEQALGNSEPDIFGCTLQSSTPLSSTPVSSSWGGPTPPNNGGNTTTTTSKWNRVYQCYDRNIQTTEQVSGAYCNPSDLSTAIKIDDGEKIWMFSHPGKTSSECQQMAGNYKVGCVSWERAYVWPTKVVRSNCRSTAMNNPKVTALQGPAVTACINGGDGEISNCNGWFRRKAWKTSWDMSQQNPKLPYYGAGCYLSYTDFDPVENTTLNIIHHISQLDGGLNDPLIGNANGCGYCTTAENTDICYGDRALDRGTCANEIDGLLAGKDPKVACTLTKVTPDKIYKVGGKTGVFAQTETYSCTTSETVTTEWEKVCTGNATLAINQGITKGTDKLKQPEIQEDSKWAEVATQSELIAEQAKAQKKADASDPSNRALGSTGTNNTSTGGGAPTSMPSMIPNGARASATPSQTGDIQPIMFQGQDKRCEYPGGSFGSTFYNDCCSMDLRRTGGKKMFGKCNEDDVKLAAARRAKRTVLVGERCSSKKKFLGCIERQKTFCTFDSMFSRVIQEQGRMQLNKIVANAAAGISEKQVQMSFYTTTPGGMTDSIVDQIYAGDLSITNPADKKGEWLQNLVSLNDENVSFFKWPWYCSKEQWKKLELLDGNGSCPSDLTLYMARCSKNCTEPLPIDPFSSENNPHSPFTILSMSATNNEIKAVSDKILIAGGCDTKTAVCDLDVKITKPTGAKAYTYKTITWNWAKEDDANALIVSGGQPAPSTPGTQVLAKDPSAASLSDKMNNLGDYLIRPYIENYSLDPNNLPKTVKVRFSYDGGANWQDINLPVDFNKDQVLVTTNQLSSTSLTQQEIALGSAFSVVEGGCKYENNSCAFRVKALISLSGKSWGSAESPDCSGMTPTQVSVLDINAMDLTEWQQDIVAKMKIENDSFNSSVKQTQIQQNMKAQTAAYAGVFDNDIDKVSTLNNEKAYTDTNTRQVQVASITNRELWLPKGGTETVSMRIAGNYPQWNTKSDGSMNVDPATKELIPNDPISRVEVDWGDCSTPTTTMINENILAANPTTREQQIQANIVKVKQTGANLPMGVVPKDATVIQQQISSGNYYIGTGYLTAHTYSSGIDWTDPNWKWPVNCTNVPVQKKAATDNYQSDIYYWEVPITVRLWTKSTADKAVMFGRAEEPYEITSLLSNYQDDLVEKHNIQGATNFSTKSGSNNQITNVTGDDKKKSANRDQYKDVVKPYTCYGTSC